MRSRLVLILLLSATMPASFAALADGSRGGVSDIESLRAGVLALWAEHPAVKAAAAALAAAQARARGAGNAIYNPQIELEYQSAEVNERTLGLRQTLDWNGKREARATVAEHEAQVAAAQLRAARLGLAASWLRAVGEHTFAVARERLAARQLSLARRFSDAARRRVEGGDLRQSDVNLALLSALEASAAQARAASELAAAVAELAVFVHQSPIRTPQLPLAPTPGDLIATDDASWLSRLPALAVSAEQVKAAQAQITAAARDRRPDPTVGLRGGRDGDEGLVAVSIEFSLTIRNDLRDQVAAFRSQALEQEQRLLDARRKALSGGRAAKQRYLAVEASWRRWDDASRALLAEQETLLEKLWESGAIEAGDYLVQLRQVVNARSEGLQLRAGLWQAWFDWLEVTGQIAHWLGIGEPVG